MVQRRHWVRDYEGCQHLSMSHYSLLPFPIPTSTGSWPFFLLLRYLSVLVINRYQSYFTGSRKLCTQHYFRKAGKFIASRGRGVPSSVHVNPFSCALELCPHYLLQDPLPSVFPSLFIFNLFLFSQTFPLWIPKLFSSFKKNFNWSIDNLQCFRYTAKWFRYI